MIDVLWMRLIQISFLAGVVLAQFFPWAATGTFCMGMI
jgi:hypothetical protein